MCYHRTNVDTQLSKFVVILTSVARQIHQRPSLPIPRIAPVSGKRVAPRAAGDAADAHVVPCSLDWFSEHPALVLSCPRTDMIRFWPLPVKHPWFEETWPPKSLARGWSSGYSQMAYVRVEISS
jgi:hypothetical protein